MDPQPMKLAAEGYRKLPRTAALQLLRQVRRAYPHHPFRETGFQAVYARTLPFYRRFREYMVDFGLYDTGRWAFYAAQGDCVLCDLPGEEPAERQVNRREPLCLEEQTVGPYVHHLCRSIPTYLWGDPTLLTFYADAPELHWALVRKHVRPPHLEGRDEDGLFRVSVTHYRDYDDNEQRCSTLFVQQVVVTPDGHVEKGPARILIENLRAFIARRTTKIERSIS